MTMIKDKNFEDITTPLSFYYTFKSQRAFHILYKNPKINLFPGKKTRIYKADHPSNIIFENLAIKQRWRISFQTCIAIAFVVYIFGFTSVLQIFLNQATLYIYYVNPKGKDC